MQWTTQRTLQNCRVPKNKTLRQRNEHIFAKLSIPKKSDEQMISIEKHATLIHS